MTDVSTMAVEDARVLTVDPDTPITKADLERFKVDEWPTWRKHAVTRAIRVTGPFQVETSEGGFKCENGWLAVDARGYPYAISADEFGLIYGQEFGLESLEAFTFNELGNAMMGQLEIRLARPQAELEPGEARDLAIARTALEDALTRYNSACYRAAGTWKRADPDRAISGAGNGGNAAASESRSDVRLVH